MRAEVISAEWNERGQVEVQSLWLLNDREVAQFQRTGLVSLGPDRHRLTQVHHVLNAARAAHFDSEIESIMRWKGGLLDQQLSNGEDITVVQRTTLNLQVAANTADGTFSSASGAGTHYNNNAANANVGYVNSAGFNQMAGFYLFSSVSGLSGQQIDSAVLSLKASSADQGTPLTKIQAEDSEAPAAPTNLADAQGRALTTASVDWDSPNLSTSVFTESPSIVSVIQELADSHDPSTILIIHYDDGSATGSSNRAIPAMRDSATANAPKLDIDHSAAGGGGNTKRRMMLGVG